MYDELSEVEVRERLAALELALENLDWRLMSSQAEQEFSRDGLRTITELTRVMFLKNPLVQRGVDVKRAYVWGQGVSVSAVHPDINVVINAFEADRHNQKSLTGHQARMGLETELQTDGNLFFAFFINRATGRVRVRTIPFSQMDEIICNPEDDKQPWYYIRKWTKNRLGEDGHVYQEVKTSIYPDWEYNPASKSATLRGEMIQWGTPIYHVKTGGFSDWKFGLSEVYDTIDWARAYKEFLEDWASIVRAYRRFAFQLSTPGGSRGIAAAKSKLQTTYASGANASGGDTNPPPVVGSTFIGAEGVSLQPIKTSGATVSADDGRRLLLMVAASMGLPETFFGDVSVGTLATAKSLDRPTELAMNDRRTLWTTVLHDIYQFVLLWAVKAPSGALRGLGRIEREADDDQIEEFVEWNDDVDDTVVITWPPLIEEDVLQRIQALAQASTLLGPELGPTLVRLVLVALGVEDVDEILAGLADAADDRRPTTDDQRDDEPLPERQQTEAALAEALRDLRQVLRENHDELH